MGAILTILAFIAIGGYGLQQLLLQIQRSEYTILTELDTDYFDENFTVSAKNGFAVAAGLVDF